MIQGRAGYRLHTAATSGGRGVNSLTHRERAEEHWRDPIQECSEQEAVWPSVACTYLTGTNPRP